MRIQLLSGPRGLWDTPQAYQGLCDKQTPAYFNSVR